MAYEKTVLFLLQETKYPNNQDYFFTISRQEVTNAAISNMTPTLMISGSNEKKNPTVAIIMGSGRCGEDYAISQWYVNASLTNGLYPVFISYEHVQKQLEYLQPNAIILSGGDFPFPDDWYITKSFYASSDVNRFTAYRTTVSYAQTHKIPTLGICAGEQVIAGILGGKIISNINGLLVKNAINHRMPTGTHKVNINKDSLLYSIVGKDKMEVSSRHNEAVASGKNNGFSISAYASDGIVEAVEPKDPWNEFALGVQWHPEKQAALVQNSPDAKIFQALASAASKRR